MTDSLCLLHVHVLLQAVVNESQAIFMACVCVVINVVAQHQFGDQSTLCLLACTVSSSQSFVFEEVRNHVQGLFSFVARNHVSSVTDLAFIASFSTINQLLTEVIPKCSNLNVNIQPQT